MGFSQILPFSFKLETNNWEYKYEEYQYVLVSCLIFSREHGRGESMKNEH